MIELRPLIVVTGTISAEGGARTRTESETSGHKITQTVVRNVTGDRRAANVIVTNYLRRLRKLIIVRTPYGALVDKTSFEGLKSMLDSASSEIASFNNAKRTCALTNTLVWEHLRGNRLLAVTGWVATNEGDLRGEEGAWEKLVADVKAA